MIRLQGTPNHRQQGAALVVGLILLLVLTLLAVSGMNTSTLEMTMASNAQFSENAFQAAETGINRALQAGGFNDAAPLIVATTPVPPASTFQTVTAFQAASPVPDGGYSMGVQGAGVQAFHFTVTAIGSAPRNAQSTNTQSFYIVGPGF